MPSVLSKVAFSEPSGRPNSLVQFSAALVFSGIYAYWWRVGDATPGGWVLVMAFGFALVGIAESLPTDRRRTAGALRIVAVLSLTALLAVALLAPESVIE